MDVAVTQRFVRMSARKARDLARRMRGMPVADALKITDFNARKGAFYLGKALKSAIADAENNAKLQVDTLRVKEAVVNEGPQMRRFWARARGSVSPVRKRMCHIKLVLTDDGGKGKSVSAPPVEAEVSGKE
jgi:large subunit ribosomal protein L22